MRTHHRWIALTVAVTGITVCLVVLAGFVLTIAHNELPWTPDQSVREHYLAVGDAYSRGFIVGFFLSFFLIVLAVVISAWYDHRRKEGVGPTVLPARTEAPPIRR
jgi:hypothetical protein